MKKIVGKGLLILSSLLLTLFLVELVIAKVAPQKTYSALYKNNSACYTKSDLVPFTLKPNCTIPFEDFDTKEKFGARINNLGFRGEDFSLDKGSEKRVLLLGDSFILGFGVRDQDIISSKLATLLTRPTTVSLPNARVVNGGYVGGFGPDGAYIFLSEKAPELGPDLTVFSVFVFNDFSDMEGDEWFGTGRLGEPKRVQSNKVEVNDKGLLLPKDVPLVYKIPLVRDSQVAILASQGIGQVQKFLKTLTDRVYFKIYPQKVPDSDASDSNIAGAHKTACIFGETCHRSTMHDYADMFAVLEAGFNKVRSQFVDKKPHFVVMIIPADFQIYRNALGKYQDPGIPYDVATLPDPNPQRRIKAFLDTKGIPYIDLLPVYREAGAKEVTYFATDGHWNSRGHDIAAQQIYQWMEKNYK